MTAHIALSSLSSASAKGTSSALRPDVFYDEYFGMDGSDQISWVSPKQYREQSERTDITTMPSLAAGMTPDMMHGAPAAFLADRGFTRRLNMFGALIQHRTLTAHQCAQITGDALVASPGLSMFAPLFGTSLVDHGIATGGILRTLPVARRTPVFRPARGAGAQFERMTRHMLSTLERVSVTGGLPITSDRQFARHNVLTAEFLLRAAEYCSSPHPELHHISGLLGERLSSVHALGALHPSWVPNPNDLTGADGILIRDDGLRLAIETTASANPRSFTAKVQRWVDWMRVNPMQSSATHVVFVESSRQTTLNVYQQIKSSVRRVLLTLPPALASDVAARIHVIRWVDIFPASRRAHEQFRALPAETATGDQSQPWRTSWLLHHASTPNIAAGDVRMLALARNASLLTGTPMWLRERPDAPQLWPLSVIRSAMPRLTFPDDGYGGALVESPTRGTPSPHVRHQKPPERLRTMRRRFAVQHVQQPQSTTV